MLLVSLLGLLLQLGYGAPATYNIADMTVVIVILLLILAAAGVTRGADIFAFLGISALAGLGNQGIASGGSGKGLKSGQFNKLNVAHAGGYGRTYSNMGKNITGMVKAEAKGGKGSLRNSLSEAKGTIKNTKDAINKAKGARAKSQGAGNTNANIAEAGRRLGGRAGGSGAPPSPSSGIPPTTPGGSQAAANSAKNVSQGIGSRTGTSGLTETDKRQLEKETGSAPGGGPNMARMAVQSPTLSSKSAGSSPLNSSIPKMAGAATQGGAMIAGTAIVVGAGAVAVASVGGRTTSQPPPSPSSGIPPTTPGGSQAAANSATNVAAGTGSKTASPGMTERDIHQVQKRIEGAQTALNKEQTRLEASTIAKAETQKDFNISAKNFATKNGLEVVSTKDGNVMVNSDGRPIFKDNRDGGQLLSLDAKGNLVKVDKTGTLTADKDGNYQLRSGKPPTSSQRRAGKELSKDASELKQADNRVVHARMRTAAARADVKAATTNDSRDAGVAKVLGANAALYAANNIDSGKAKTALLTAGAVASRFIPSSLVGADTKRAIVDNARTKVAESKSTATRATQAEASGLRVARDSNGNIQRDASGKVIAFKTDKNGQLVRDRSGNPVRVKARESVMPTHFKSGVINRLDKADARSTRAEGRKAEALSAVKGPERPVSPPPSPSQQSGATAAPGPSASARGSGSAGGAQPGAMTSGSGAAATQSVSAVKGAAVPSAPLSSGNPASGGALSGAGAPAGIGAAAGALLGAGAAASVIGGAVAGSQNTQSSPQSPAGSGASGQSSSSGQTAPSASQPAKTSTSAELREQADVLAVKQGQYNSAAIIARGDAEAAAGIGKMMGDMGGALGAIGAASFGPRGDALAKAKTAEATASEALSSAAKDAQAATSKAADATARAEKAEAAGPSAEARSLRAAATSAQADASKAQTKLEALEQQSKAPTPTVQAASSQQTVGVTGVTQVNLSAAISDMQAKSATLNAQLAPQMDAARAFVRENMKAVPDHMVNTIALSQLNNPNSEFHKSQQAAGGKPTAAVPTMPSATSSLSGTAQSGPAATVQGAAAVGALTGLGVAAGTIANAVNGGTQPSSTQGQSGVQGSSSSQSGVSPTSPAKQVSEMSKDEAGKFLSSPTQGLYLDKDGKLTATQAYRTQTEAADLNGKALLLEGGAATARADANAARLAAENAKSQLQQLSSGSAVTAGGPAALAASAALVQSTQSYAAAQETKARNVEKMASDTRDVATATDKAASASMKAERAEAQAKVSGSAADIDAAKSARTEADKAMAEAAKVKARAEGISAPKLANDAAATMVDKLTLDKVDESRAKIASLGDLQAEAGKVKQSISADKVTIADAEKALAQNPADQKAKAAMDDARLRVSALEARSKELDKSISEAKSLSLASDAMLLQDARMKVMADAKAGKIQPPDSAVAAAGTGLTGLSTEAKAYINTAVEAKIRDDLNYFDKNNLGQLKQDYLSRRGLSTDDAARIQSLQPVQAAGASAAAYAAAGAVSTVLKPTGGVAPPAPPGVGGAGTIPGAPSSPQSPTPPRPGGQQGGTGAPPAPSSAAAQVPLATPTERELRLGAAQLANQKAIGYAAVLGGGIQSGEVQTLKGRGKVRARLRSVLSQLKSEGRSLDRAKTDFEYALAHPNKPGITPSAQHLARENETPQQHFERELYGTEGRSIANSQESTDAIVNALKARIAYMTTANRVMPLGSTKKNLIRLWATTDEDAAYTIDYIAKKHELTRDEVMDLLVNKQMFAVQRRGKAVEQKRGIENDLAELLVYGANKLRAQRNDAAEPMRRLNNELLNADEKFSLAKHIQESYVSLDSKSRGGKLTKYEETQMATLANTWRENFGTEISDPLSRGKIDELRDESIRLRRDRDDRFGIIGKRDEVDQKAERANAAANGLLVYRFEVADLRKYLQGKENKLYPSRGILDIKANRANRKLMKQGHIPMKDEAAAAFARPLPPKDEADKSALATSPPAPPGTRWASDTAVMGMMGFGTAGGAAAALGVGERAQLYPAATALGLQSLDVTAAEVNTAYARLATPLQPSEDASSKERKEIDKRLEALGRHRDVMLDYIAKRDKPAMTPHATRSQPSASPAVSAPSLQSGQPVVQGVQAAAVSGTSPVQKVSTANASQHLDSTELKDDLFKPGFTVLKHATEKKNVQAIEENGLQPRAYHDLPSTTRFIYGNGADVDADTMQTPTADKAAEMLGHIGYKGKGDNDTNVIIVLPNPESVGLKVPFDDNYKNAFLGNIEGDKKHRQLDPHFVYGHVDPATGQVFKNPKFDPLNPEAVSGMKERLEAAADSQTQSSISPTISKSAATPPAPTSPSTLPASSKSTQPNPANVSGGNIPVTPQPQTQPSAQPPSQASPHTPSTSTTPTQQPTPPTPIPQPPQVNAPPAQAQPVQQPPPTPTQKPTPPLSPTPQQTPIQKVDIGKPGERKQSGAELKTESMYPDLSNRIHEDIADQTQRAQEDVGQRAADARLDRHAAAAEDKSKEEEEAKARLEKEDDEKKRREAAKRRQNEQEQGMGQGM